MRGGLIVVVVGLAAAAGCSSGDGRELPEADPDITTMTVAATATTQVGSSVGSSDTAVTPDPSGPVGEPVGFDLVAATITTESGEVCELCLWLADSAERRSRGLMSVTELGAADGMVFRYPTPTSTTFWMKDTPTQLSIVFFDDAGAYVESLDMEPCVADPCPRYPTPNDFVDAIEFPQGTADDFGATAGSVLVVTDLPCHP